MKQVYEAYDGTIFKTRKEIEDAELCPICGYELSKNCQCLFGGTAHPDRSLRRKVVLDHLYLFSPKQIQHIIDLQRHWQTSYSDERKTIILDALKEKYSEKKES